MSNRTSSSNNFWFNKNSTRSNYFKIIIIRIAYISDINKSRNKNSINIIPVKNVDEVLKIALKKPLKRIEWVDVDKINKVRNQKSSASSRH